MMEGPQCRFRREARARERHQHPVGDSLKVLDPKRPIREADVAQIEIPRCSTFLPQRGVLACAPIETESPTSAGEVRKYAVRSSRWLLAQGYVAACGARSSSGGCGALRMLLGR